MSIMQKEVNVTVMIVCERTVLCKGTDLNLYKESFNMYKSKV